MELLGDQRLEGGSAYLRRSKDVIKHSNATCDWNQHMFIGSGCMYLITWKWDSKINLGLPLLTVFSHPAMLSTSAVSVIKLIHNCSTCCTGKHLNVYLDEKTWWLLTHTNTHTQKENTKINLKKLWWPLWRVDLCCWLCAFRSSI